MQKLFKNLEFTTKSLDEKGYFSGYASVFNVQDSHFDIILPGAFSATINKDIKLVWQHILETPIGKIVKIHEDTKGLYIEAKLNLQTHYGYEAYSLLKSGCINGLSIGFVTTDFFHNFEGIRFIKSIDLYEISIVTLPANEQATVLEVKSESNIATLISALKNANYEIEKNLNTYS